jgi:hypothetical protein
MTIENLGTQVIEGILVEGTRMSRTLPPRDGLPSTFTIETWDSVELKVNMLTKSSNGAFLGPTLHSQDKSESMFSGECPDLTVLIPPQVVLPSIKDRPYGLDWITRFGQQQAVLARTQDFLVGQWSHNSPMLLRSLC